MREAGFSAYMGLATLNFAVLLIGYRFRHTRKKLHAALMSAAIFSDLGLVLALELQRDAIATATSFKLSFLNQMHILSSSIATLLYFPVLYFGARLLWGQVSLGERNLHRRAGKAALIFRGLGFLLMFSMLEKAAS